MSDVLLWLAAAILLALSGLFSGLNIGLMMARPDDLKRKARQGDKIAARVYRYRKDGYYLIFCILLGNMTNGVVGGLIATLLITMFGEILPQAIFSQRGYRFVRYFFWLLDVIYVLFWPLAQPMSKLLNRWLGKETPQLYSHQELEEIIHEHAVRSDSPVDYDESRIAAGALQFSKKTAGDLVTPMSEVFVVDLDDELDATLLAQIKHAGHSRIPVQSDGELVGVLYVKDVVGRDLPLPISQLYRDKIYDIDKRSRLDTVLSRFIQTHNHLFVVMDDETELGIITLEDVIEEILDQEIEDEYDEE